MVNERMGLDGFWLPAWLREKTLAQATWEMYWLKGGSICPESTEGAVAVRWPRLTTGQWADLLSSLSKARKISSHEIIARWQQALDRSRDRLVERAAEMIPALAAATGYSPEMLMAALGQGDLIDMRLLAAAARFRPTWCVAAGWERMPGLAGQVRFFPARGLDRARARLIGRAPLLRPAPVTDLVLGYAAGNVPGTAVLISLLGGLANAAHDRSSPAPALLVRNSRHEPLFAPWLLEAVEAHDPELVAGLAVLIWDYEQQDLQADLMRRAGLMIAAAGDETIAALDAQAARYAPALRFHRHGHKVSFAVLHRPTSGAQLPLASLASLAALDSSVWDQNGCLSARVHFVAGDADSYADALAGQMRELATRMPRGATPRRFVHRAFDTYMALAGSPRVRVCSTYDDGFLVAVDGRPWQAETLARTVNACMGRVVIVRPVEDVLEASRYLRWLPRRNLQSISLAMDDSTVSAFAEAAGAAGVTAIRSLGRAAFPQLAYSWDGLLPLDTAYCRPDGHFTTVEFDDLQSELAATAVRWGL